MEGYTVNLQQLNGDEVIRLYLTGMGFHAGQQGESGLQLKNALLKLEKTLPAAYQADIHKAKNVFILTIHRGGTNIPQFPVWKSLGRPYGVLTKSEPNTAR